MIDRVNQSKSHVEGDQIAGDQYTFSVLEVKKELAAAKQPIRTTQVGLEDFGYNEIDGDSTILITKLKDGGFTPTLRTHAKKQKLQAMSIIVSMTKSEHGKELLNDVYSNLLAIINMKYIAELNEGETLKTSFKSILGDLSDIVTKYEDVLLLDESFLEGLLYVATSRCALKWKMEGEEDDCENDC